jgi:diguanylate cyclase (GGDEF)-like protein/PAS domain S-box-containing protein
MRMFPWLRAFAQPTTYLGLVMIAVIWSGAFFLAKEEREHAYEAAVRQGSNLTHVFEEYIARVVKNTDSQLLVLRDLYRQREQQDFDLPHWINDDKLKHDLVVQYSIAGRDGILTFSNLGPIASTISIKDRAHFRVHADSTTDELYISEPVIGRLSGQSTIQLSRRLTAPDGTFGGVIVASLDILQIQKFYNSIDVGRAGMISLIGFDGIIRARSDSIKPGIEFIGKSVAYAQHFETYRQVPNGSYWNSSDPAYQLDGVRRLISYRVVEGLPLIAVVGLAESDIFQQADMEARNYYLVVSMLTAFVLLAIGFSAFRQMRLASATASLEQTNMRFDAAIENMAHGLCMFDRDKRLLICNKRYGEMYGLTPEQTKPGTTLCAIREARVAAGSDPKDVENYINTSPDEFPETTFIRELRDGRSLTIHHQKMPDGGWVSIHQDITAQRLADERAETSNQELITQRAAIDQATIVTTTDVEGRITYVNGTFCQVSGYSREELLGKNHNILNSGTHSEEFFRDMYWRITRGEIWRGEICNKAKNGALYWVDTTIVPRLDASGKPIAYMAIRVDVTARKEAQTQIAHIARHDALTDLSNRTVFVEEIERLLSRLHRHGETFSVFMLDLDRFKDVNDSLGHSAGDALLKETARRLKASLRETDVLARLGGDEFAIIQTSNNDQREDAIALAIRIIECLDDPFKIEGNMLNIGTSIGIALAPEDGTDSNNLMKRADMALYRAKAEGRNGYAFFDPAMTAQADARHTLENDLRRAIANKELELHYQPVIDVKTCKLCAVEALVRWRHPRKGFISPDQFIPVAEATGLIIPLGEWVLQQACADAVTWPAHVKVAVNLSPVQFKKSNLMDVAICALVESGLPPQRLEVEITETVLLENEGKNMTVMRQLKNLGISIALDDFGTGYSSLKYLTMFPFDKIKIDKSFTLNMTKSPASAAIIATVLSLGRSLDIATTAEGVETKQDFESLRVSGVNFVQGFLFSRAVPASELDFNKVYEQYLARDRASRTVAHVA